MQNITNDCDENKSCKSIRTLLSTPNSDLTALAQLVAIHMANGTADAKQLAELTGYSERAIRKAKAELECQNQGATEPGCRNYSAERNPGAGTPVPNGTPVPKNALARVEEKLLPPQQEETGLDKNPLYPPNVIAVTNWNTAFAPVEPRCQIVSGKIVLGTELRGEWLDRFGGDEEGLDLALTQAAAYVQTNNTATPLEARISSQLARIVADRRDKDRRYAAAASQKAASAQTQTAKPSRIMEAIARRSAAVEAVQ